MVLRCLDRGLRAAGREWRLALVLWIVSLLLAALVTFPALRWWNALAAYSPEASQMLTGIRFGVLAELMSAEHADGWRVLFASVVALIVLARLLHAFLIGGLVHVLADGHRAAGAREAPATPPAASEWAADAETDQVTARSDPPATAPQVTVGDVAPGLQDEGPEVGPSADLARPLEVAPSAPAAVGVPHRPAPMLHRFFEGAGRYFLRNLIMLVLNALGAAIVGGALVALARFAVRPLEDTLSVPLAWVRLLLPVTAGGLAVFYFLLVYDYACLRLGVEDNRQPVRTWLRALAFVMRRAGATACLWLGPWVLLALAAGLYLAVRAAVPVTTLGLIVVMIAAQQVFTIVRATLRVATVAAEMEYASGRGFLPNL